jgi:hypothetical protein
MPESHATLIGVTGVGATGCPLPRRRRGQALTSLPPFQVLTGAADFIPPRSRPHTPIRVNGEMVFNDGYP